MSRDRFRKACKAQKHLSRGVICLKKLLSIFMACILAFSLSSCADKTQEEQTENTQYLEVAPILGLSLSEGETAGFFALTKDGTYSWKVIHEDGTEEQKLYDGVFCLDNEDLVSFTRVQAGTKAKLTFTGNVMTYSVYCAPAEEIESDKTKIKDDKYKINPQSAEITFPTSGKYYYLVDVFYAQGEVPYGFVLAE